MTTITYKQYDSFITRVVNQNLKKYKVSPSHCTISNNVKLIVCVNSGDKTMDVEDDWKEKIKGYAEASAMDSLFVKLCRAEEA